MMHRSDSSKVFIHRSVKETEAREKRGGGGRGSYVSIMFTLYIRHSKSRQNKKKQKCRDAEAEKPRKMKGKIEHAFSVCREGHVAW